MIEGEEKNTQGFLSQLLYLGARILQYISVPPPLSIDQMEKSDTFLRRPLLLVPFCLTEIALKSYRSVFWSVYTHVYFIDFKNLCAHKIPLQK